MAIYRHLSGASFGEADVARLGEVYERVLKKLRLVDRKDPITELIATKIIEVYRSGEHDPSQLCSRVLKDLGVPGAGGAA